MHSGFYSSYMELKKSMLKYVQSYANKYKTATIVVTGHSLGVALATFEAADIKQLHPTKNYLLYTYSGLIIGNQNFTNWLNQYLSNAFRVFQYAGRLSHLPLNMLGFQHGIIKQQYSKDMSLYMDLSNDNHMIQ